MGGTTNSYHLGIDLGTTYTATALRRGGDTRMATLGNRAAAAPSVLLLRDDGAFLHGEAAELRGETEPHRLAREFKRRLGDPVPLILDGTPFAADALMARTVRWVVDTVTRTEGEPPAGIAVTHPANWGDYKRDLLRQALRVNDLERATMVSEPEAAAVHYATEERLADGATVAVYDLGGGTFDAAVLRRAGSDWQLLGHPEGVERLGGIDVDAAVFAHVVETLNLGAEPDPEDTGRQTALHRLRRDCVTAKEVLSEDTDTSIPVLLPDLQTQVRLTRAELEAMIRPTLSESIVALNTALRSAEVGADELDAVLLVGGSSRIPLAAEMVSAELGRPVVVNAHPKHSIALGAAVLAGAGPAVPPARPTPPEPTPPPPPAAPPPVQEVGDGVPAAATRRPETRPPAPQPGGQARVAIAVGLAVVIGALAAVALVGNPFDGDDTQASPETDTAADTGTDDTGTTPPDTSPPTTTPPSTPAPTTTVFVASEPPLSQVPTPAADLDPDERRHEILEPGTGDDRIGPGDEVTFQFVGRLSDGTVFVNSWETSGEVTGTLGEATFIEDFELALHGLTPGARAEVYLGSEVAYGSEGNPAGNIPPDSPLAYLVDIIAVNGQQRYG